MSAKKNPLRKEVLKCDKWNLASLYESNEKWENDFNKISILSEKIVSCKGCIGESKESFLDFLKIFEEYNKVSEKLYHYAFLLSQEDLGDSALQEKINRLSLAFSKYDAEQSFIEPEIMAIDEEKINEWIQEESFADYRIWLKKKLHAKSYTLSEKEERIISLTQESLKSVGNAFSALDDGDLEFGTVNVNGEEVPLTHGTYSEFLENPDRNIRKQAYEMRNAVYIKHANTLAALYAGSVNNDIFNARARGYNSCLHAALYGNNIPESVYTNLLDTVHRNLDCLHKYYSLRKKILGLDELRSYDCAVSLVSSVKTKIKYEQAVEICRKALSPLGNEYTDTLCNGLLNGWCDRYENKGKTSGAFSFGAYAGYPYILLNYNENILDSVFTMAHEGGHSMHSLFSAKNNPFMCYDYSIFEAEVASIFNEQLLFHYLLKEAELNDDKEMQKYLIARRCEDIIGTLYVQAMFAEFELVCHETAEKGIPLTLDKFKSIYREILLKYDGKDFAHCEGAELVGIRIPHFYNAFYCYQYATGISAAIALARKVISGGEKELNDYFTFLKSGGSRYPIDALRLGGVDMLTPEPVQAALDVFRETVDKLEVLMF